ncbi:zincin, partial [Backusella circina FSU 941]
YIYIYIYFVPQNVSIPDTVIVTTPQYFSRLNDWFSNADHSLQSKTLYEFFFIKATLSKIDMLDSNTREIYRIMHSKIGSGTTAPPLRVRECIGNTADLFGQMLGRYFVMLKFGGEEQRLNAAKMIDNIRSTWANRLDKIEWLDDVTRKRAVDKVNSIDHQEAYSIHTPDDRSPKALKEYYNGIIIDSGNYYENQMSGHSWFFKKEWSRVGQPVDKTKWYMDPQDVNAYYSPTSNQVVVPAGILQPPFYGDGLPEYLNYGGIGVVIGHEITHAFDNSGRLYDGGGHLSQWWTNETSDAFQEKTKCFVKQYGNFSIEGVNGTTYNVNGKLTLGENLADNGGVHAAWTAMKKTMESSPEKNLRLPGLEDLTPEQLFFINFGRVWCTNMRPQMAVQRIRSDVHSPAMVRVNAAVQNNVAFNEAFKCGAKKPMNPEEKCLIW